MLLALGVFLGFQLLILVHEAGHLLVARWIGAPVAVFSLGFGKAIWSWRPPGSRTTFQLARIPLGGYVEVEGEFKSTGPLIEGGFWRIALWRRALYYLGGATANLVFAFLLAWPVMAHLDRRVNTGEGVFVLQANAAGASGLAAGDRLKSVNGLPLSNHPREAFEAILEARAQAKLSNSPVLFQGDRRGARQEWFVDPAVSGSRAPWITVGLATAEPIAWIDLGPQNIMAGLKTALVGLWHSIGTILGSLVGLVFGVGAMGETVGGPLSVAQTGMQWAEAGPIVALLGLAVTSLNMAVFNLLPVPMLDGGHLLFIWWEAATNRSVPGRVQVRLLVAGAALLAAFVVTLTLLDAVRIYGTG